MAKIDFNDLINPVGSTAWHSQKGNKGLAERAFHHSEDNPYMKLVNDMIARGQYKDEEIADLYAKAYQWEGDQARWIQQLEVDQAIKEEQREYDSPLAQVQRQREAGINPDLASLSGSGVGSGSGTSSGASSPDNISSIGRTDPYAGKYYQLAAIQTAADFAQTMANSTATIIGSVNDMRMLPSQMNLNTAQAGLMDAQAAEINTLLNGKKQSLDLTNTARGIDNSTAILQQLARFSELISPDTVDFAPHLQALGVEEAKIAPYTDIIKQMHANPEMRAKYAADTLAAKWSEEENDQYTQELVGRFVSSSIKIKEQEQQFQEDYTAIQARVQDILANDPTYATNQSELIITDAKQARDQQDFAIQMFQRDVATYGANIQDVAWSIKRAQSTIGDIYKKASKEKRKLSPVERATVEDLQTTIRQMRVLGSQQVQNLYGLEKHANRLKFYSEDRIRPATGESEPLSSLQRHNIESRIVFDDVLTDVKTGTDIALDVTSRVLGTLGMAGAAYVGGKGVSKGFTPKRGSGIKMTKEYIDVNGMRVSPDGHVSYTMK